MTHLNIHSKHHWAKPLLEEMAYKGESVKYYDTYETYYIEMGMQECSQLWVYPEWNNEVSAYELKISIFFAETKIQALAFYSSVTYDKLASAQEQGWSFEANLNLSYRGHKFIWVPGGSLESFIGFWNNNLNTIHQRSRLEALSFFNELTHKGIIQFNEHCKTLFTKNFLTTKRMVDTNPALSMQFVIPQAEFIQLDKEGELAKVISQKVSNGLKFLNKPLEFLKKLE